MSLHEYAHELWLAAGEEMLTRHRHLRAAVAYWAAADAHSLEAGALGWVEAHLCEVDNLRAALRWARVTALRDADPAITDDWLALLGFSGAVWHRAGLAAEGAAQCAVALPAARAHDDPRHQGGVSLALATLSCFGNAPPASEGLVHAREAADAFQRANDPERAYYAHYLAWTLCLHCQQPQERPTHLARMRSLLQPQWSPMLKRYWRASEAYEQRLAGDTEAYLDYARSELARRRQAGFLWESWVAAAALGLAECDRGNPDAAIAVLDEALAEIRAAGRLHQNAARVALWVLLLAEHREPAVVRAALAEAVPVMAGAGNLGDVGLPLAWLAHKEDRLHDAATLLAWFDSPRCGGSKYGPGTHLRRSANTLSNTLAAALSEATRTACNARGEALDEAAALQTGLSGDDCGG
jgi:tetratricopeptide (TPR) repeat protein